MLDLYLATMPLDSKTDSVTSNNTYLSLKTAKTILTSFMLHTAPENWSKYTAPTFIPGYFFVIFTEPLTFLSICK